MANAEKKKEDSKMADAVKKVENEKKVTERVGKLLECYKTRRNEDNLRELLKLAENAIKDLKSYQKQSQSLKLTVKPLIDSLHGLLLHKDRDVKPLVCNCILEIIRTSAPNLPLSDKALQELFKLLLDTFGDLGDIAGPDFSIRAKLLEEVAQVHYCVLLLDAGCENLALKMVKTFFKVVREDHPQYVVNSMSSMMTNILEEKLKETNSHDFGYESQPLLDVILQNIIKNRKGVPLASFRLAASVIQHCGPNLKRGICSFLTMCISNRDASGSPIKEFYHTIITEVFQLAPEILPSIMPCLTNELMANRVDVRIKAVNLVRKLLLMSGSNVAREYCEIFVELLNVFSDPCAEVRLSALSCAKGLYNISPEKVLDAIRHRLLDNVCKVRAEAVNAVCDLAKDNLNLELSDLLSRASERLLDKKVSVRRKALKKLLELYKLYCTSCEMDTGLLNKGIEEIPCHVLMLCYKRRYQEHRPEAIEPLLDLFPPSLPMEVGVRHWMYLLLVFKPAQLKALKIILQKRRLQDGLTEHVDLDILLGGNYDTLKVIEEVGKQLECYKTRRNKDNLIILLRLAENAIKDLIKSYQKQSQSLKLMVKPLIDSLRGLFLDKDRDVKPLVGNCILEIIRTSALNLPLSDKALQDFFRLVLDTFGDLGDIAGPYFSIRAKLLEEVSQLHYCVLLLDTECEHLALKMVKTFFKVVREDHPQYVVNSMSLMMTNILEEKLKETNSHDFGYESQPFLDVILQNIIKNRKGVSLTSFRLAASVIQHCGPNLERGICSFLTMCMSNRHASASPIKDYYHTIILEVFQLAPHILPSIMPCLTNELMASRVDVRVKAVNLVGKLLLLSGSNVEREYCKIYAELLNGFYDASAEVRLSALSCAKGLYNVSPEKVLDAIRHRLLDHVCKVRAEAVKAVCDLAKDNLNLELPDLVSQASERLLDKKVSVRRKALKKLLELYKLYCTSCERDTGLLNKGIEEIPCHVLMLCNKRRYQEHRPEAIEHLLDLFPPCLSMEERVRHWKYLFSVFKPAQLKALKIILKKRRLQDGLTKHVDLDIILGITIWTHGIRGTPQHARGRNER